MALGGGFINEQEFLPSLAGRFFCSWVFSIFSGFDVFQNPEVLFKLWCLNDILVPNKNAFEEFPTIRNNP